MSFYMRFNKNKYYFSPSLNSISVEKKLSDSFGHLIFKNYKNLIDKTYDCFIHYFITFILLNI